MSEAAPRWDMTSYFSGVDAPDCVAFCDALDRDLKALVDRLEEMGSIAEDVAGWALAIRDAESLNARVGHLGSYLGCLKAADSSDAAVSQAYSAMSTRRAMASKVSLLIVDRFRDVTDAVVEALLAETPTQGLEYCLRRYREQAAMMMPRQLELLANDLSVTGYHAWGRLYSEMTGTMRFTYEPPEGDIREVPMAWRRSLMEDADAATRVAVLEGSNEAFAARRLSFAAALNAISGQRLALYKWRNIPHFLDVALFDARISRATLDAMHHAIAQRRHVPWRYLRRKAALLGKTTLGIQDMNAPLPLADRPPVTWGRARAMISQAFHSYNSDLGAFADLAFERRWIDAEPRDFKRPGGFCSSSSVNKESRIFMTFNDTLGDVQTLAHELGHAFHNYVMRDLRPLHRSYPMTLAETASVFAETVLGDALLASTDTDIDRAEILDTRLKRAVTFMLNIPMRFMFEERLYTERSKGELSVERLQELMIEAQQECYGEILDRESMDPWFWASKGHFYITHVSFYNFPYAFGYLFSLGVFARAREAGPEFFSTYIELLRQTGRGTAEEVAHSVLGVDLTQPDFWLASIDEAARDLDPFDAVTARLFPNLG